jgi:hypothetical protein
LTWAMRLMAQARAAAWPSSIDTASADSGNASMGERLGEQLQRFKKSDTE